MQTPYPLDADPYLMKKIIIKFQIAFKYLKFVWFKNSLWRWFFFIFFFPKVLQKFAF
jgi:hypothetical protein